MYALDTKRFIPTELGEIVYEVDYGIFPGYFGLEFTAKMEQDLDNVEEGK